MINTNFKFVREKLNCRCEWIYKHLGMSDGFTLHVRTTSQIHHLCKDCIKILSFIHSSKVHILLIFDVFMLKNVKQMCFLNVFQNVWFTQMVRAFTEKLFWLSWHIFCPEVWLSLERLSAAKMGWEWKSTGPPPNRMALLGPDSNCWVCVCVCVCHSLPPMSILQHYF